MINWLASPISRQRISECCHAGKDTGDIDIVIIPGNGDNNYATC